MAENRENSNNQVAGAVTYPRQEEDALAMPAQPRQPRDLQGLLRFAMEANRAEDESSSMHVPMTDERRKFLEEALSSMTVDVVEVIRSSLKILTNEELISSIQLGQPLPEEVKTAFGHLFELIEDIDMANDFYKIGGFNMFPVCLSSENESVRATACWVLGDVCQNNPYCQARALDAGLLRPVLTLMHTDQDDALVKEVYAASCMCRGFEPACAALVACGGCAVLARVVSAHAPPAARTKAAFFITHLAARFPPAAEKFIELNLVKSVAEQLKKGRDSSSEHLLSIILTLVELYPAARRQSADPQIQLQKILQDHLKDLKDDTCKEEREYGTQLLKILENCPDYEYEDEDVDR